MLALLALSGCSSLSKLEQKFENRLVMTLSGDELSVNSKWGIFGITSKISDKDKEALFRLLGNKE